MFALEHIDGIHERLGDARTLYQYVQALRELGVGRYDSYVEDGHSEYFGRDGHSVTTDAAHQTLHIANISNRDGLAQQLSLHKQGKTSYIEMSRGLAQSGVERWTVDTHEMTLTFYDRSGTALMVEVILPGS
jgi:uncharacterized protein YbcV (DUF1398 family)